MCVDMCACGVVRFVMCITDDDDEDEGQHNHRGGPPKEQDDDPGTCDISHATCYIGIRFDGADCDLVW